MAIELSCIFIEGLRVDAIIGIYPEERLVKQPLVVDLELYVDFSAAANSTLLEDTVDYDSVVARVIKLIIEGEYKLIESLAVAIADTLLTEFNVKKVSCRLSKPNAVPSADSVGVKLIKVS